MGDDSKRPHPAIVALLLAVSVLMLAMFPLALYANTMALIDGYKASHGTAGTPGTATVESAVDTSDEQVCRGTFTPGDGGPATDARIEVEGRCEEGQRVEARFMPGRSTLFTGYSEPRAWAAGAGDWGAFIPLVVLFGLLSLPLVLLVWMIVAKLTKRLLNGPAAPTI
ncbi:hypothetical protein [Glycomyces sp. MUSA5-2]|uniref:hypothetical protein n=1 Tax=Glycomyces sp. MUSA5-2 TaxID=2053002 RepID=UPI0030083A83